MKAIIKKVVPTRIRRFVRDVSQIAAYGVPNPLQADPQLSPRAQSWFETLHRDGIVKIENNADFQRIADYLDEVYFVPIEKNPERFLGRAEPAFPFGDEERFVWDTNEDAYASSGTEILCYISFLDSGCRSLFLNDDLIQLLFKYYGRQPYYRNQPLIQKISMKPDQKPTSNASFHVDHLHQITMMLLVTDVSESDTHMEYCQGSNRRNLLLEGVELTPEQCEPKIGGYPIFKCTGKKGTLFIFDTSGFHRANYISNSTRKILHLNITTGHNLVKFVDRKASFTALENTPRYVKRMFHHLNPA